MGVAVAVLAALPSVPHFASRISAALAFGKEFSSHGVPVLVRGGMQLASSEAASRALTMATIASSMLLVMMGWAIARSRSHVSSERSAS